MDHRTPRLRCFKDGWDLASLDRDDTDETICAAFQVLCGRCNLRKSRRCETCVREGTIQVPPPVLHWAPAGRFPLVRSPTCEGCYFHDTGVRLVAKPRTKFLRLEDF